MTRPCRRLRPVAALLLAAAAAAAAVEVPELDERRLETPGGRLPVVFLPGDHAAAVRLIHHWNAVAVLLAPSRADGAAAWPVPSVRELYGASGKGGGDASSDERVLAWRVLDRGVGTHPAGPLSAAEAAELAFDLRRWAAAPGSLVLAVPSHEHRRLIQAHVDATWQAWGHRGPPRPGVAAGPPPERIPAPLGWAALGGALVVLLAVAALVARRGRRRSG